MNINLTLLIQVINFWLAYAVLKKIVLEPGYKMVECLEAEHTAALERIHHANAAVTSLAVQKQEEWRQFQRRYHISLPAPEAMPSIKIPLLEPVPLDKKERQTIISKVSAHILGQVLE